MTSSSQSHYESLRGRVYEYLHNELFKGSLKPGQNIDLNELANKLGVSRTPLREALILLDSENFVTIQPRSRVTINTLEFEDIRYLYEIIGALESAVLNSAKDRMSPDAIDRMEDLNHQMAVAVETEGFDECYGLNLQFHGVFLATSKNIQLLRDIDLAKRRLFDFPSRSALLNEWMKTSLREHTTIVHYLRAGDFHAAADYLRDVHWSFESREDFIKRYYELAKEPPASGKEP